MTEFIILYIVLVLNILNLFISEMFYLQSAGYDINVFIHDSIVRFFKFECVFMLMLSVVYVLFNFIFHDTFLIVISYLLMLVILLIIRIIKTKNRYPKFTKRMIRIVIFFVVSILIISYLLFGFVYQLFYLYVFYWLIFILLFLIVNFILNPIEKMIGLYYIYKAKNKLATFYDLVKIGITGSYGKTSTKEILYNILSVDRYVLCTPKSYNTPFGITKTIINNLNFYHEIFVCEMGAKKLGEINQLCKIIDVDMGIVTSVGRQHLNTFGSIENVYKTKSELSEYLEGKFCVFNLMNFYVKKMYDYYLSDKIGVFYFVNRNYKNLKIKIAMNKKYRPCLKKHGVYFEYVKSGNVYAKNINADIDGLSFDLYYSDSFVGRVSSELIGMHNVLNILMAVSIAIHLGISYNNICLGISKTKSIHARFEKIITSSNGIIINNGYNSNLDSAKSSFEAFDLFDKENKIVVTPGLIDCDNKYECNYKFGRLLSSHCNQVYIIKNINKKAIHDGLLSAGFDESNIKYARDFDSIKDFVSNVSEDTAVLIENDLPANFK